MDQEIASQSAMAQPPESLDDGHSVIARKFDIISIKCGDLVRWNKEWEKILRTLSASEDVYPILRSFWDTWDPSELPEQDQILKTKLCEIQKLLVEIWHRASKGDRLSTAWLISDEAEQKRHLLQGLEEACKYASFEEDGRALSPEITLKSMLKQRGKGFIEFISGYYEGIKDSVGEGNICFLPSEWWKEALDTSEPFPADVEIKLRLLTMQRNEFIALFLSHTALSVMHDLIYGSPQMDPVIEIMKADGTMARAMGETLSKIRDKPLIRCENCAKSSEDSDGKTKFMVCSTCRTKLNFSVHYCSQTCQKDDWRHHKKHCGKDKVLKNVKGTALDPFWAHPTLPDYRRPPTDDLGNVRISSLGFGTLDPSHPHSAALQRQVSLVNGDKDADYFLFDETDHPIRFAVQAGDMWTKLAFRQLRSGAMFSANREELPALVEHLIKMGQTKELSRERVLDQMIAEYGDEVPAKLAHWESMGVKNGLEPGQTFVEMMSKGMATTTPRAMSMLRSRY